MTSHNLCPLPCRTYLHSFSLSSCSFCLLIKGIILHSRKGSVSEHTNLPYRIMAQELVGSSECGWCEYSPHPPGQLSNTQ